MVFPEGHPNAGQPLFMWKFIPSKLSDNPYLAKDGVYEANLLSLPENQRRQLLEGDWAVATGAAFPEFRTSIHTGRDLAKAIIRAEEGDIVPYGILDSSCWHQRGMSGPSIAEEMIREGLR